MITLKIQAFIKNQKMARPLQYILASFPNNGLPAEQTKGGRPEEREEWNHERFLLQNVDKDTLWHWNQWKSC